MVSLINGPSEFTLRGVFKMTGSARMWLNITNNFLISVIFHFWYCYQHLWPFKDIHRLLTIVDVLITKRGVFEMTGSARMWLNTTNNILISVIFHFWYCYQHLWPFKDIHRLLTIVDVLIRKGGVFKITGSSELW